MPYPVTLIDEGWHEPSPTTDEAITIENFWEKDWSNRFVVGVAIEDRILELEKRGEDVSSLVLPFAKFIMMNCIKDGIPYNHPESLLTNLKN